MAPLTLELSEGHGAVLLVAAATAIVHIGMAEVNFLENISFFLAFLLASGVAYPWTSTVLGVIFLLGRIVYFLGYSTGRPEARNYGAFWTIGLLGLMISTIVFGLRVLGVI
ncbi:unnamed protein product [Closterium sp. Naga37s-1]|nr:unnamed protein product [Closterium sp. Naga37s-1]